MMDLDLRTVEQMQNYLKAYLPGGAFLILVTEDKAASVVVYRPQDLAYPDIGTEFLKDLMR